MEQQLLFDTRRCRTCDQEKLLKEFYNKTKGIRYECIVCERKRLNAYIEEVQNINIQFLIQHPCVDCGVDDIEVLTFNHINTEEKEYDVSFLIKKGKKDLYFKEIEKCEVLCHNCHAKRTARQFGSYKLKYKIRMENEKA